MNDEVAKSSPWDVFIHLLAVIALYVCVYSALSVLFQFANLALPDPADRGADPRDDLRYGVSMLIVFFPAYWLAWRSIEADLAANPGKRRLWIRTCPIYLTLFLAGMLALGDVAYLLYYFMSGDLTSRFLLKVLSVFVVTGGVLLFYRNALRREPGVLPPTLRAFAYASATFVGILIVTGFLTAGSPMRAHLASMDLQRLRDLDDVKRRVVSYWQAKETLPTSLDQLKDEVEGYSPPRDPVSGDSYDYRTTGAKSFELCGNFALKDSDATKRLDPWRAESNTSTAWNHDAGHYCFQRTIDPQLYHANRSKVP